MKLTKSPRPLRLPNILFLLTLSQPNQTLRSLEELIKVYGVKIKTFF